MFTPRNKNKKKALPWHSVTPASELMPKEYGTSNVHARKITVKESESIVLTLDCGNTIRECSIIQPGELLPGTASRVYKTTGRPIEKCVPVAGKKQVLRWGDWTKD